MLAGLVSEKIANKDEEQNQNNEEIEQQLEQLEFKNKDYERTNL